MGLVPSTVTEKWYHSDHWVYRNFHYLFNNPLWQKRAPSGFSECPLFWFALFAVSILRPTIWVVVNVLRPAFKRCGRTVGDFLIRVDNRCRAFLRTHFGSDLPEGMGVLFLLVALALGLILVIFVCALVGLYKRVVFGHANRETYLWIPLGAIIFQGIVLLHRRSHKKRPRVKERCKIEAYWWVLGVMALITIARCCQSDLLWVGRGIVRFLVAATIDTGRLLNWLLGILVEALIMLGNGLAWLGGHSRMGIGWCAHHVAVFVAAVAVALWNMLVFCPWGYIPWWIWIGVAFYVLYLLGSRLDVPISKGSPPKPSPFEPDELYRFLADVLGLRFATYRANLYSSGSSGLLVEQVQAIRACDTTLLWRDLRSQVPVAPDLFTKSEFEDIRWRYNRRKQSAHFTDIEGPEDGVARLGALLNEMGYRDTTNGGPAIAVIDTLWEFVRQPYRDRYAALLAGDVKKDYDDILTRIQETERKRAEEEAREESARVRRENSRFHKWCKSTTARLEVFFKWLEGALTTSGSTIWHGLCFIGRVVVFSYATVCAGVFVTVQFIWHCIRGTGRVIRDLLAAIWSLVRSAKKGVCAYRQFEKEGKP